MSVIKCNDMTYDSESHVLTVENKSHCVTEDVAKFFGILASGRDAPGDVVPEIEDSVEFRLNRFTEASNLRQRLQQALERARELEVEALTSWLDLVERNKAEVR